MSEIKARGRWMADSSVRRYQKAGRVVKEIERMGTAANEYAEWIENHLGALLSGDLPCPAPPGAGGTLLRVPRPR